jgi:hypothetical protein
MSGTFFPNRPTTITDRAEIANAISLFNKTMTQDSDRSEEIQLGFQGGGLPATVHWISGLDLWASFRPLEKRYWVALGVGNPFDGGDKSIIVEVNFPFEGINRRVGGVFVKDGSGRLFIGHRGRVGGGRPGIGKKAFMAEVNTEDLMQIRDGDKTSIIVMIGALDAPDFPERLSSFVNHVQRFKAAAC